MKLKYCLFLNGVYHRGISMAQDHRSQLLIQYISVAICVIHISSFCRSIKMGVPPTPLKALTEFTPGDGDWHVRRGICYWICSFICLSFINSMSVLIRLDVRS